MKKACFFLLLLITIEASQKTYSQTSGKDPRKHRMLNDVCSIDSTDSCANKIGKIMPAASTETDKGIIAVFPFSAIPIYSAPQEQYKWMFDWSIIFKGSSMPLR